MDAYTKELLGRLAALAAEHNWMIELRPNFHDDGWIVVCGNRGSGPTLADALAALLRDLGVSVPGRPSDDEVTKWVLGLGEGLEQNPHDQDIVGLEDLRELDAREPLIVDAMLGRIKGGPS